MTSPDHQDLDHLLRAAYSSGARIGEGSSILSERFRVLGQLGEGGMGAVYEAQDLVLERTVALKAMQRNLPKRGELRARFLREARILSGLEHPHVCRLYDFLQVGDADYLVMERIVGQTLDEVDVRTTPLPVRLRWAEQVAQALLAAHEAGIVHRDLKPSNVMVDRSGQVKVLDFGVAVRPSEDEPEAAEPRSTNRLDAEARWTTAGRALGTPRFMSPEQARGGEARASSDLYSFGLLLHLVIPELRAGIPRRPGLGRLARVATGLEAENPASRPSAERMTRALGRARTAPRRWALRGALATGFLALSGMALKYTVDLGLERDQVLARQRQAERMIDVLVGDAAARIEEVGPPELIQELDRQALLYFEEVNDAHLTDLEQRRRLTTLAGYARRALGHGRLETAREILDRCAAAARDKLAGAPENLDWLFESSQVQFYLGQVHRDLGRPAAAEAAWTDYLDTATRLVALDPDRAEFHDELAWARTNVGVLHLEAGRPSSALVPLSLASEHWEEVLLENPDSVDAQTEVVDALSWTAQVHQSLGRIELAEGLYRREVLLRRTLVNSDPENVHLAHGMALAEHHLARSNELLGRYGEALEHAGAGRARAAGLAQEAGGHAALLRTHALLEALVGRLLDHTGRHAEAHPHHLQALALVDELIGRDRGNLDLALLRGSLVTGAARNDLARGERHAAVLAARRVLECVQLDPTPSTRRRLQGIEGYLILAEADELEDEEARKALDGCARIRAESEVPLLAHRALVLALRLHASLEDRLGARRLLTTVEPVRDLPADLLAWCEEDPHE